MKQRLLIFAYGFIGWTIFFLVARALFLAFHYDLTRELSVTDVILTFVHGIRMDWAAAGYLSLLPGLLLGATFFLKGKNVWPVWLGYHIVFLIVSGLIIVIDLELYTHWAFRMDATPLLYIGQEAAGTSEVSTMLLLMLLWMALGAPFIFFSYRFFKPRLQTLEVVQWTTAPALLLSTALLFIPIRGSFGVAPMNTGFVYFHKSNTYANHAAINVVWNFGYAVHKMERLKYPENFLNAEKTQQHFAGLYPNTNETTRLLNTAKPNVIILVIESYTYKFIEPLGGLPGIAPNFNALVKEGILFDNFYSSGDRTDKGLISILSAYPAQPLASIIKYPNKTKKLPFLNQVFKENGYYTGFTYGCNVNYANFNSYLMNAGFDNITHSDHFPAELNTGKWGVHDEFVYDKLLIEAAQEPRPFFKMMMTQSSHEPFEVPMETVFNGNDRTSKFINAAHYADKALGTFIEKAKKSDWWNNTLLIITADHGHPLPDNGNATNPKKYKIPMLWVGGAVAAQDTVIHTLAGHTDIANTVLAQLGMYDDHFLFSHNMLSPDYNPFAMFIYNNGFGFIQPHKLMVYDNAANAVVVNENSTEEDIEKAKAFMQTLYSDFNSH
jgi:phosphoglycerol transferase MdoB-like AlkP superfamily enzyme